MMSDGRGLADTVAADQGDARDGLDLEDTPKQDQTQP